MAGHDLTKEDNEGEESPDEKPTADGPPKVTDHRKMGIRSVIDVHAWNEANWRGTAYIQFHPRRPPGMALMFENREAARSIFERWRERVGREDSDEEIRISIIRNLPEQPPPHYTVMITANPDRDDFKKQEGVILTHRMMTMQPENDVNLKIFLESNDYFKAYYLLPAILKDGEVQDFIFELSILKWEIIIRDSCEIGEHDIDRVALRGHLAPRRNREE